MLTDSSAVKDRDILKLEATFNLEFVGCTPGLPSRQPLTLNMMNPSSSPTVFWALVCLPAFYILQKIFGLFQVTLQGCLTALLPQLVQQLIKEGLLGLAANPKQEKAVGSYQVSSDTQRPCRWNWGPGAQGRPRTLFSATRALLQASGLSSLPGMFFPVYLTSLETPLR